MGPPPRSLTAEANSCFMVRVPHGPNRIQGCGASIAPERGLPSDQLYRTSNNEGHRVAVTLDTKVLRSKGDLTAAKSDFRSSPNNRHEPTAAACRFRAKGGNRGASKPRSRMGQAAI